MARQYNIKWSDKDEQELKRIIKNFNSKVRRLEQKEPYLQDVRPDRIVFDDLKERIQTRQDFNRELNRLKRFSRKGSERIKTTESGVVTTEWQFKEAVILQRTITTKRRKKRQGIESWQTQEAESLFDKPKVSTVPSVGFKKYVQALEREVLANYDVERQIQYRNNYISTLNSELGIYAIPVIDYVLSIPIDIMVRHALTNPMLRIEFIYTDAQREELAESILDEWQRST